MGYIVLACIAAFVGWKCGRKYQDFQDIMLARRVAKIVEQGRALQHDKEQYQRWQKAETRIAKKRFEDEEEEFA